ncbi:MAG: lamin tail domain-containing protein [Actinomycetota bacterium]
MRRLITIALTAAIAVTACTSAPPLEADETTTTPPDESTTSTTEITLPPAEEVVRGVVDGVIDGDTLQATIDGRPTTIGLIGVDAPGGDECYGEEARTILASLVAGKTVVLTTDTPDADTQDRPLRYVIIENDPPVLVNAELVSAGAVAPLHNGHEREADFLALGDRAYASGRGMWGTFVCGQRDPVEPDRPQLRIGAFAVVPMDAEEPDLTDEWVEIVNQSYTSVDIGGWSIRNETGEQRFTIPSGSVVSAGSTLRVVTGCGANGGGVQYWCSDAPIWSKAGETIVIQDRLGNAVDRKAYAAGS